MYTIQRGKQKCGKEGKGTLTALLLNLCVKDRKPLEKHKIKVCKEDID